MTSSTYKLLNVAAGPTQLLPHVVVAMGKAMVEFGDQQQSVAEHSHRSPTVLKMITEARANAARIFNLPSTHEVVFLPGGARHSFMEAPRQVLATLRSSPDEIAYISSGLWAEAAIVEATKLIGRRPKIIHVPFGNDGVLRVPDSALTGIRVVHATSNESADGSGWRGWQQLGKNITLIIDASSDACSYPIDDWSNIGVYYAGTQKMFGPAGYSLAIVRKDIVDGSVKAATSMPQCYAEQLSARGHGGLANTIDVPALYGVALTLRALAEFGGASAMDQLAAERARIMYNFLDNSRMFKALIPEQLRSRTTMTFKLGDSGLHRPFVDYMTSLGIIGVEGHPGVFSKYGGPMCRVSFLSLAHTEEDAKRVVAAMKQFESEN